MRQELGDRAGEAAAWFQLGVLADKLGRTARGVELLALCFLIDRAISHGDTESDLRALSAMASRLDYTQEQFDAMLQRVAESYRQDRGAALLRAAFGEAEEQG